MKKPIEFKPYTIKQISVIYGVSLQTIRRWLIPFHDKIGKRQGHFYNVNQVRIIFESFGIPD